MAGAFLTTGALTGWNARWGYFLALSGALAMPFALRVVRQSWLGYALFAASLWPVALSLENELFPQGSARSVIENLHESQQVRSAAMALKAQERRRDSGSLVVDTATGVLVGKKRCRRAVPTKVSQAPWIPLASSLHRMKRLPSLFSERGTSILLWSVTRIDCLTIRTPCSAE